jgi:hypothetical protein
MSVTKFCTHTEIIRIYQIFLLLMQNKVFCASTLYMWTVLWWLGHNEYYL